MRSRVSADDIKRSGRWLEKLPEELEGWPVCKQYDLHRGEIVARFPAEDFEQWEISWPLEETPDLFLRFARLYEEADFEQAAFAFTYEYGLPDGALIKSPFTDYRRPFPDRMNLSRFLEESRRAWIVLSLYECFLTHDVQQAQTLISEHGRPDSMFGPYFSYYEMDQAARTRFPPELMLAIEGAVIVAKQVSDDLCTAHIDFSFDNALELDPSCIRTYWDFHNLIGAMYLQMYWLMTSGGTLARCENCGRMIALFRTDPKGRKRRRDRRFCDDACRQAHHRSKDEA
jgi:hypothetical protein